MSFENDSFPLAEDAPLRDQTPGLDVAIAVVRRLHWDVKNWVREEVDAMQAGEIPDIDPTDMTGACAIVSWMAQRILTRLGIKTSLVRGEFDDSVHCWLEIGDIIVDGTATQFFIRDDVYVTTPGIDCRYQEIVRDEGAEVDFQVNWNSQSPYRFQGPLLEIEDKIVAQMRPRGRRSAA